MLVVILAFVTLLRLFRLNRVIIYRIITGILILGLAAWLWWYLENQNNSETVDMSPKPAGHHLWYTDQLGQLSEEVSQVSMMLAEEHLIVRDQLTGYERQLNQIQARCQSILKQIAVDIPQAANDARADSLTSAKQLCGDLIPVVDYSKQLYQSSHEYLMFNPSDSALKPGSPTAQARADELLVLINQSIDSLGGLAYPSVNDPALKEIEELLKRNREVLKTYKISLENFHETEALLDYQSLLDTTTGAQDNILRARSYYWTNTININALSHTILRVKASFEALG